MTQNNTKLMPIRLDFFGESGATADDPATESSATNTATETTQDGASAQEAATTEAAAPLTMEHAKALFAALMAETEAQKIKAQNAANETPEEAVKRLQNELSARETADYARSAIAAKGLNPAFAELIPLSNIDKAQCDKLVAAIETTFRAEVQKEVTARLAGTPPKSPSAAPGGKDYRAALADGLRKTGGKI